MTHFIEGMTLVQQIVLDFLQSPQGMYLIQDHEGLNYMLILPLA